MRPPSVGSLKKTQFKRFEILIHVKFLRICSFSCLPVLFLALQCPFQHLGKNMSSQDGLGRLSKLDVCPGTVPTISAATMLKRTKYLAGAK